MAAYRRVYDSRHLQADCQELGSAPKSTLGNRVSAIPFYHSFMQRSPLFIPLVLNFSAVCIVFEALNVMCTFVATKSSRRLGYDVHSAGTLAAC